MKKEKLGKLLLVIGVIIAILPVIAISGFAYYSMIFPGEMVSIRTYLFLINGIAIWIVREVLRRW
jgi:hypothetical protein